MTDMHSRNTMDPTTIRAFAIVALLALTPARAHAHDSAGSDDTAHGAAASVQHAPAGGAQEHAFGEASDPADAARTIEVTMHDAMRFEPALIAIDTGTPVRFVVRNDGNLMHEMVLGTRDALAQHADLMKRFPGMEHAEPYMAHVDPGASGEIGWTFTQPGEYFYACLVPGHYEAGMLGRIVVR